MEEIFLFWFGLEFTALICSQILQVSYLVAGKPWRRPEIFRDKLFIATLAIAAAMAALQLGVGLAQKAKAAKLAKANRRPPLEDNPYTQEAYDLTASRAQQGLSDSGMQAYQTANDRNLASNINAVLRSGGSSNNIASLYEGSQTGLRTLALADDEARQRNINQFLTAGLGQKADEDRDKWYLNRYVPFQDMAELSSGLSKQGMDNIWKGVNTGVTALTQYGLDRPTPTQAAGPQRSGQLSYINTIPMPRQPYSTGNIPLPSTGSIQGYGNGLGWQNPAGVNTSLIPLPTQGSRFKRFDAILNQWVD